MAIVARAGTTLREAVVATRDTPRRLALAVVRWAPIAIAALLLGSFVWVAVLRCRYPFELEWMEGGMVDHVARVLRGQRLYVQPSVDFVPFIYNPFYYYLAAPFAWALGADFLALRLVSILSTLVSFALLFELVRRETGHARGAILAAGIFAGTYPLSGGWFDVARVDSACVALCLGALFVARWATRRRHLVLAAALAWLAFETKQNALAFAGVLAAALLARDGWRRATWYAIPLTLLVGGGVTLANVVSGGWYAFYAFRLPAGHPVVEHLLGDFWKYDVFGAVPIAVGVGLYLVLGGRLRAFANQRAFYVLSSLGLLIAAFVSRIHSGSYVNDAMPAHAALALWFGLGVSAIAALPRVAPFVDVLATVQLAALLYPVAGWVPSSADRAEGDRVMAYLAGRSGDVWLPHHTSLMRRLGKSGFAQEMAIEDVLRSAHDSRGASQTLRRSIAEALAHHRFGAVVLDDKTVFMSDLRKSYRSVHVPFVVNKHALYPRSGARIRPHQLYVPRRPSRSRHPCRR